MTVCFSPWWLGLALLAGLFPERLARAATPAIEITSLPAYGSFANLAGRVLGAPPADHRVAVFIYVPGAGWFSKPTCGAQLTPIQADGGWTTDITTGGSDQLATRVTALLVSASYSQACVQGAATLPAAVLAEARASVTALRSDPSTPRLAFSSYDWLVKGAAAKLGPGPNFFSNSTNNVWIDGAGRLHLKITHRDGQWQCAEVMSLRSFGHGFYRFYVDTILDNLNVNVILGLFTYSDTAAFAHREIDFEFSRWGNVSDVNNAQFVVQPFNLAGHLRRYRVSGGLAQSTHVFNWDTNRIFFQSLKGASPVDATTNRIGQWTFTDSAAVPPAGDEIVHLNLWLMNGNAPTDAKEAEVVITRFEFVPPGAVQPPLIKTAALRPDGRVQLSVLGETDRRYELQSAANLPAWSPLGTLLATNAIFEMGDTPAGGTERRFYRVLALP